MRVLATKISDLLVIEPEVFLDDRGSVVLQPTRNRTEIIAKILDITKLNKVLSMFPINFSITLTI